ncbi:MAG: BREX system Lon protease-like protein BrxL [Candidatus Paceibacterota bacterium]
MTLELENKIKEHFEGKVVRKDLTKFVKGNAVVPTYVLEYLLGQHCASSDEEIVQEGIERVKNIISNHYVHRDESELVKSTIREKGKHKIIDRVTVTFNDRQDNYEAEFSNLGLKKVEVRSDIVKKHQKLLTGGVWSITDLSYMYTDNRNASPWVIDNLNPIQLSTLDFDEYIELRKEFSRDEWIRLLIQSMGLNPDELGPRQQILQLIRLIPYCERNYNLIELGPKGTGKSHIYSEFSPHGILISGGDVTVAKLFVNNNTGNIGLVGYWDVVAFDEFAGRQKKPSKSLVDIMKNYMANKTFSRGKDVLGAEASMVFVGNTDRSVAYMLRHSDLFDALPTMYHDSAFLDRLHYYLPGWEIAKLRNEMFSTGYGFVVDYLAEALRHLKKEDFSTILKKELTFSNELTSRDRDGVTKTFSGLVKLIYPNGDIPKEDMIEFAKISMEGRKRVKDQLVRIDDTFEPVKFYFTDSNNEKVQIETPENVRFKDKILDYTKEHNGEDTETADIEESQESVKSIKKDIPSTEEAEIKPGSQKLVVENQTGITYDDLFAPCLKDATKIEVIDPYLRLYYQIKNFMEFCDLIMRIKPEGEVIHLNLVTSKDDDSEVASEQIKGFDELKEMLLEHDIVFEYKFDEAHHDRSIITDTGWKIDLGRGLDIFQPYDFKNRFNIANLHQGARKCKQFSVTYLEVEK